MHAQKSGLAISAGFASLPLMLQAKAPMRLLPRLLHLLILVAVLAAPAAATAQSSGSTCLKIAEVQVCVDPALPAAAKARGLVKCSPDAILAVTAALPLPAADLPRPINIAGPASGVMPVSPWKPPRVLV